jgi:tetratricopeptide (TPR) repeat protein
LEFSFDKADAVALIEEVILTYSSRPESLRLQLLGALNKLSFFYKSDQKLKQAAQVFESIYEIAKVYNESIAFVSLVEASFLYSKMNDQQKALDFYEKSKNIFPKTEYFDYYFQVLSRNFEKMNLDSSVLWSH